jgi:chorismate mutase
MVNPCGCIDLNLFSHQFVEDLGVEWRVRAIRGATTASENSVAAIQEVVSELLDELETRNQIDANLIISVIFSVTRDLDAIFPAAIARQRPNWDQVALFDVQQMHVEGGLERCIRFLIHVNLPASHPTIYHPYLRQAKNLRPDWSLTEAAVPAVQSHRH